MTTMMLDDDSRVYFHILGLPTIHKLKVGLHSALRHVFRHVPWEPHAPPGRTAVFSLPSGETLDGERTPADYGMAPGETNAQTVHVGFGLSSPARALPGGGHSGPASRASSMGSSREAGSRHASSARSYSRGSSTERRDNNAVPAPFDYDVVSAYVVRGGAPTPSVAVALQHHHQQELLYPQGPFGAAQPQPHPQPQSQLAYAARASNSRQTSPVPFGPPQAASAALLPLPAAPPTATVHAAAAAHTGSTHENGAAARRTAQAVAVAAQPPAPPPAVAASTADGGSSGDFERMRAAVAAAQRANRTAMVDSALPAPAPSERRASEPKVPVAREDAHVVALEQRLAAATAALAAAVEAKEIEAEKRAEAAAECDGLRRRAAALEAAAAGLEAARDDAVRAQATSSGQYDELRQLCDAQAAELDGYCRQLEAANSRVAQADALRAEVDALSAQNMALIDESAASSRTAIRAQAEASARATEAAAAAVRAREAEDEAVELHARIVASNQQLAEAAARADAAVAQRLKTEDDATRLRRDVTRFSDNAAAFERQVAERVAVVAADARAQSDALREELLVLHADLRRINADHEHALTVRDRALEKCQRELQLANERLATHRADAAAAHGCLDDAARQRAELEASLLECNGVIVAMQAECAFLRQAQAERERDRSASPARASADAPPPPAAPRYPPVLQLLPTHHQHQRATSAAEAAAAQYVLRDVTVVASQPPALNSGNGWRTSNGTAPLTPYQQQQRSRDITDLPGQPPALTPRAARARQPQNVATVRPPQ